MDPTRRKERCLEHSLGPRNDSGSGTKRRILPDRSWILQGKSCRWNRSLFKVKTHGFSELGSHILSHQPVLKVSHPAPSSFRGHSGRGRAVQLASGSSDGTSGRCGETGSHHHERSPSQGARAGKINRDYHVDSPHQRR